MKKYMAMAIMFLLTGCPGDKLVPRESATVIMRGSNICVVSPLESHEHITAIQINSTHSNGLHEIFDSNPVYIAKGECLPLFGYLFIPGEKYSVAYDIKSADSEAHLIIAEVSR